MTTVKYLSIYKEPKCDAGMRISCNFVNVYTIRYRIRVHVHITNAFAGRAPTVGCHAKSNVQVQRPPPITDLAHCD